MLVFSGEAVHESADGQVTITGRPVDVTQGVRSFASDEASRQIRQADERRAVIDQAAGVVSAHTGLPIEDSFSRLRGISIG